jgi:DNA-binding transcriptional MerR regulator/effector-binding domain-containing protein
MWFTIGEFSKVAGLTVKALRFYHEKGLLVPACVDPQSGYRYYGPAQAETARVIVLLRDLGFTLEQIREIVATCADESDLLGHLEAQQARLAEQMRRDRRTMQTLTEFIHRHKEARKTMSTPTFKIEEKVLEPLLAACVRMRGKYSDCGQGFGKIGRAFGRHISGPCFLLHHDDEYKEDDASFEACMPVRGGKATGEIELKDLPGGRCLSLVHKGPYSELGPTYERLLTAVKERSLEIVMPTREIYLKGPGMIFRGNPKNYLTEVQFLVRQGS